SRCEYAGRLYLLVLGHLAKSHDAGTSSAKLDRLNEWAMHELWPPTTDSQLSKSDRIWKFPRNRIRQNSDYACHNSGEFRMLMVRGLGASQDAGAWTSKLKRLNEWASHDLWSANYPEAVRKGDRTP